MKVKEHALQGLISIKPRPVVINESGNVKPFVLNFADNQMPVFEATLPESLGSWANKNTKKIDETFSTHGILLFRNFLVDGQVGFSDFTKGISGTLMNYSEASTPRTKLLDKIYTSTEYAKEQFIQMHNEHSYSNHWPQKIWFYCETPAFIGGETPVANSKLVFDRLDVSIREEFARKKVLYSRNYYDELDLSWQTVFQTNDKSEVEQYCKKNGIKFTWKKDGNLRTEQVSQAVIAHPRTHESLWFNQAHLFHISNLEPNLQSFFLEQYGKDDVPRNAYFGDRTDIPLSYLNEIKKVFQETQMEFKWQKSDVLMLDNMLYAHGRNSFEGDRKVLVAMADVFPEATGSTIAAKEGTIGSIRQRTASYYLNNTPADNHLMLKYKLGAAFRILDVENLDEGGISGHISLRVPGEPDVFWVNPFGLLAQEVSAANLLKVDKYGTILEGEHPLNVAGFCIHSALHAAFPEVNCIVHTHSPWGTLFSALGKKIEPIDQNCCLFFENHALYDQYNGPVNTEQEAAELVEALKGNDVLILKNHGTIACGNSIESALMRMVAAERAYRLNVLALQTPPPKLIDSEIARLTRTWIGNDIAFKIEFDALLRKVEKLYPDIANTKPHTVI